MRSAGTGTCLHFSARRCLRTPASRRCRADRFRPEHLYKPPQPSPTGGKCGRASKATTAARVGAGSRRQTLVHTSEGHVLLARFQAPRSSPPHAPNPPLSDRNTELLPRPSAPGSPSACSPPSRPRARSHFPNGPLERGFPASGTRPVCWASSRQRSTGSLGPSAVLLRPPPNLPTPSGPKPLCSTRCFFLGTLVTREGEEKRGSPHGPQPGCPFRLSEAPPSAWSLLRFSQQDPACWRESVSSVLTSVRSCAGPRRRGSHPQPRPEPPPPQTLCIRPSGAPRGNHGCGGSQAGQQSVRPPRRPPARGLRAARTQRAS